MEHGAMFMLPSRFVGPGSGEDGDVDEAAGAPARSGSRRGKRNLQRRIPAGRRYRSS